jgi:predicted DNA repair protein MutK
MASGFFALLDDIAALMDDVASMSKIATKKTAGILGDDLAVNAEKAVGFSASRELPVLWVITKRSFLNKLIILPIAFLLSAFLPAAITPILLLGGAFLAYEAIEKISEYIFPHPSPKKEKKKHQLSEEELKAFEKQRIRSAILVDFILSVEIVIIALSTVTDQPLDIQIGTVSVVAILATIGVYGMVALIVRLDDFGLVLTRSDSSTTRALGRFFMRALPVLIRIIGALGTAALVLVSGGIFVHNIHAIHDILHAWPSLLAEVVTGLLVGTVVFAIVKGISALRTAKSA